MRHFFDGVGIRSFILVSMVLLVGAYIVGPSFIILTMADYVPIHTLMEIFSVTVCVSIFAVGWNAYSTERPQSIVILSCALLGVALLDTLHLLSYPDMPNFITANSGQKSIFLWLCSRTVLAIALLTAALVRWRPLAKSILRYSLLVALVMIAALCGWIALFHLDWIPPLYVQATGLTPLKVAIETLIAFSYAATGIIFALRARRRERAWMQDLARCCWIMAISEVYFTLFRYHSDILNVLGHAYKVIAYYFLYRAIFLHSVRLPILQLKASDAALRSSQQALNLLKIAIDRSDDYVLIFNRAGRFVYANAEACRRIGYDRQQLLSMSVADISGDYNGDAWVNYWTKLRREHAMRFETMHKANVDTPYPVEVVVTLVEENGEELACAIVRDISERQRAQQRERELLLKEERARIEARTKSEFLARMSHEIRTPMNGILGMSEMLRSSGLNEIQRGYNDIVYSSATALLTVINDILDFSKIEAGHMTIENVPFDLQELVLDALNLFQLKASEKNLELLCDVRADIPAWVSGDPTRLRQILINFLSNAIKFTDRGKIVLTVQRADNSERIRFVVEDTGPGIPAAVQVRLFESFTQADTSVARSYGGTGLGLAISKQLAELMGGAVGVHSEISTGSRFWVELPLPTAAAPAAVSSVASATTPTLRHGRSLRLLVAEDNATNQLVIQAMLRKLGHDCLIVADGPAALNAYTMQHAQFDGILMDCEMPGMSGFEATQRIRELEKNTDLPHCPIIALTAHALEEHIRQASDAGMDGHLAKPLSLIQLDNCIAQFFAPYSHRYSA